MILIQLVTLFCLGAIFGSFANVLVDRGQKGKSLWGRSHCDSCKKKLAWSDNIPVLSFLLLRGKCKYCRKKLSWQYPLVETGMGLLFVLIGYFGPLMNCMGMTFLLLVGFLLAVIFVWDLKYLIIPDQLIVTGLILTFCYYLILWMGVGVKLDFVPMTFLDSLAGAMIVSGFFAALFYISSGRWIGGGDVKIGFWLGFLVGWKMTYFLLLIAYVLGGIVAILLIINKSREMKSKIAFGPFLVVATMVVLLFGQRIIEWFLF